MGAVLNHNKIGQLDTFTVHGNGFRAVVLKQGAQLIHFLTEKDVGYSKTDDQTEYSDNWLWVSEQAEYIQGESVRGGVPICWPVFGQFDANPDSVKNSFTTIKNMPQHGYARTHSFELESLVFEDSETESQTATLILRLDEQSIDNRFASAPNLALKVVFTFSVNGFGIELITQNNSDDTVTFSQALHTYLPTADIRQTHIAGFEGTPYSDALTKDWDTSTQTVTQHGDISFTGEVDRIYHGAPDITLNTPDNSYQLSAKGSNSTVVWNPWIEKSQKISQFADDNYQRMLCIETANAHLDVVELEASEVWEMGVTVSRS